MGVFETVGAAVGAGDVGAGDVGAGDGDGVGDGVTAGAVGDGVGDAVGDAVGDGVVESYEYEYEYELADCSCRGPPIRRMRSSLDPTHPSSSRTDCCAATRPASDASMATRMTCM